MYVPVNGLKKLSAPISLQSYPESDSQSLDISRVVNSVSIRAFQPSCVCKSIRCHDAWEGSLDNVRRSIRVWLVKAASPRVSFDQG